MEEALKRLEVALLEGSAKRRQLIAVGKGQKKSMTMTGWVNV